MTVELIQGPMAELVVWFARQMRTPRLRTYLEFAEEETVLPSDGGPYAGERFRADCQPYAGLLLNEFDNPRWRRFAVTGPSQSGKTLIAFCVPILYRLFEVQEPVVCGLPDINMADDKWKEDLLPVIEMTRYRDLLPLRGPGSRGGAVKSKVTFRNGCPMRFMTGGGGSAGRAAFTAPVVVATEVDSMDEASGGSRETDKVTQLETRTASRGEHSKMYMECTPTTSWGRITREYLAGTASRILKKCPHCDRYVVMGRENLVGWQEAENELDAMEWAHFACSSCGAAWTEEDRALACRQAILVHRGQDVDAAGNVVGEVPKTLTLGFRWDAVDNLFVSAGETARKEWTGARGQDETLTERWLHQYVWGLAYDDDKEEMGAPDANRILERTMDCPKGVCPKQTAFVTAAMDLGMYICHWCAVAWWGPDLRPHVIDYGRMSVASVDVGVDRALAVALREFLDIVSAGWATAGGGTMSATTVLIDSRYQGEAHSEVVYDFCRGKDGWFPAKGFGASQAAVGAYRRPTAKSKTIRHIGDGYHVAKLPGKRILCVDVDADRWKTWIHERLNIEVGNPGALTLFAVPKPVEHLQFARQLAAERSFLEYKAGVGWILRWEQMHRQNHFLDTMYLACAAGDYAKWLTGSGPGPWAGMGGTGGGEGWFAEQRRRK